MAIHLVRHAKAGARPAWNQPDELRPLTDAGVIQAMTIADALVPLGVTRVASSRYVRCVQTIQPLADKLDLEVEIHRALAEEASIEDAWVLLESAVSSGEQLAVCSHGNIISPLLDRLHRRGVAIVGDEWTCKKGSIWSVQVEDGTARQAVQTLAQA